MAQPRLGSQAEVEDEAMEYGIFNLMGARQADKPTAQVFEEVAEQTRLADELGYTIAWFAEHHFSNYCLCASPLMMVALETIYDDLLVGDVETVAEKLVAEIHATRP